MLDSKGLFVETIAFEESFKTQIPTFKNFFQSCILPELLTCKLKNGVGMDVEHHDLTSDEDKQYCFYGETKQGRMIACDNSDCPIE